MCWATLTCSIRIFAYKDQEKLILQRGIQLTNVQRYHDFTVKMVLSYKSCTLNEANTCARTFLMSSIMDHNVQLLKPLNKRELYAT
jgi:hypothetical protein